MNTLIFGILFILLSIGVAKVLNEINDIFKDGDIVLGTAALLLFLMVSLALVKVAILLGVDPLGIAFGGT